jgi:predicted nucleic acid-binding protein
MSRGEAFFDTSVLMYLISEDAAKADRAEAILGQGGVISAQVLNEFSNAANRKSRLPWAAIREILDTIRGLTRVAPISVEMHENALDVAERYQFSFYDSLIVAAAQMSRCSILYCEDLQHGQRIGRSLRVVNPFSPT